MAASIWDWLWRALIVFGLTIAAWALFRAWHQISTSPMGKGMSQRAWIALPALLLAILVGVRPALVIDMTGPSVHRLLVEVRLGLQRDMQQLGPGEQPESLQEQPSAAPLLITLKGNDVPGAQAP